MYDSYCGNCDSSVKSFIGGCCPKCGYDSGDIGNIIQNAKESLAVQLQCKKEGWELYPNIEGLGDPIDESIAMARAFVERLEKTTSK